MQRVAIIGVVVLGGLAIAACSASTRADSEPEDCLLTYDEPDPGRPSVACLIPADSTETCLDVARCFCREWNPEATAEEIEECAYWETYPRAMITLSDYCNPHSELSLAEAVELWSESRGGTVVTEPECDEMPATLPYW